MIEWIKSLTLSEWSMLSQLLLTFITFLGIVFSLWLSRQTLKEVQIDRKLRQKPHLAFEPRGQIVYVEFSGGKAIPGVNINYVRKVLSNLPNDIKTIRLKEGLIDSERRAYPFYGCLKNYGLGPALATEVIWIPQKIWIGSESFSIDEKKLSEPIYSSGLNSMPALPEHILPEQQAELSRLPSFIVLDYEKKIKRVDGVLSIEYEDVFGEKHKTVQLFRVFTHYDNEKPQITVTFSDIVKDGSITRYNEE